MVNPPLVQTVRSSGAILSWQRVRPRVARASSSPLLLIHGFACGKGDWGALPKMLAAKSKRDVLCFDNRGVGDSSSPEGPYTIAQMVDDARVVVDAAGVERVSVLGISLGGMIAQSFALEHPGRTNALILGCTTHGGREALPPPAEFFGLCQSLAAAPDAHDGVDSFLRWMLPPELLAQPGGAKFLEQFRTAFLKTSRTTPGLLGQLAAMGKFSSIKSLEHIASPTLVISGDEDAVVPPGNSASLVSRIDGARLRMWEGAGHFWWAHKPVEVAELLARFLVDCDPPAAGGRGAEGMEGGEGGEAGRSLG